jgi:hypothetical protein
MRVPKKFGKRSSANDEKLQPKIRYFLAFEGEKTEYQYFQGLIHHQDELGINELIEITPLLRHHDEKSWSNPYNACQLFINDLRVRESEIFTVGNLISHVTDWVMERKGIPTKARVTTHLTQSLIKRGYKLEGRVDDDKENITNCICSALDELCLVDVSPENIGHFRKYLKEQKHFNKRDGDVACLIVDRDSESFTAEQYDSVVEKCKQEHIDLYVTNPRFEFWLLLHFLDKGSIDCEKVCQKRVPGIQHYLEQELHKRVPGISKRNVPFDLLVNYLDVAIVNEKEFCEEITGLKNIIGSNIGRLMTELKIRHD